MQSRKASAGWQRAAQIGVLGLVWGIGILALLADHSGSQPAHAARPLHTTAR